MEASYQDGTPIYSFASASGSIASEINSLRNYLLVPGSSSVRHTYYLSAPLSFEEQLDKVFSSASATFNPSLPRIIEPEGRSRRQKPSLLQNLVRKSKEPQSFSSAYSTESVDSETTFFSSPPSRIYRVPYFPGMASSRSTITTVSTSWLGD